MQLTESQRLRVLGLAREIARTEIERIFYTLIKYLPEKVYKDGDRKSGIFTGQAKVEFGLHVEMWTKRITEIIEVE